MLDTSLNMAPPDLLFMTTRDRLTDCLKATKVRLMAQAQLTLPTESNDA